VGSSVDISLRSYDGHIFQAYRRLFPDDSQKSPELLEWRFLASPHGPAKFAVSSADGEIVGMIALIPTPLLGCGGLERGYQAIDTVVDPSFRGRRLFVRMGEAAQDSRTLGGEILS
jgi:hypothetical protein